jgi:hypothetical protein
MSLMGGGQFNDLCIYGWGGRNSLGRRSQPLGEQLQTKETEDKGKRKSDRQPGPEAIVQGQ